MGHTRRERVQEVCRRRDRGCPLSSGDVCNVMCGGRFRFSIKVTCGLVGETYKGEDVGTPAEASRLPSEGRRGSPREPG